MFYTGPQSYDIGSARGGRRGEMEGWVGLGLVMPSALPDFGTNIKNAHEERIKDHEQTEMQRAEGAGW